MLQDALSLSEARRIALAAQGFDRPRPRGPVTVQHLRRAIRQLGLVQIDYRQRPGAGALPDPVFAAGSLRPVALR